MGEDTNALSLEVNNMLERLIMMIDYSDIFDRLTSFLPCTRPLTIQEKRRLIFAETDRMISKGGYSRIGTCDCDKQHEVLELVLSRNHCAGGPLSSSMAVVVEIPDQEQFIDGRSPLPKTPLQTFLDGIQEMINLLAVNPIRQVPIAEQDRWIQAEQHTIELLLNPHCGRIQCEHVSRDISVFVRRASQDEIAPYAVDFHVSQKPWYQRMCIRLTQSTNSCLSAVSFSSGLKEIVSASYDDEDKIPGEIAVKDPRVAPFKETADAFSEYESARESVRENVCETEVKNFTIHQSMWIQDLDVVLESELSSKSATVATTIFHERVLPVYAAKKNIRRSHLRIMKLMLQEELRDDAEMSDDEVVPESTFWIRLSELDDERLEAEEYKSSQRSGGKWLRLDNGDFVGPYVVANDAIIQQALQDACLRLSDACASEDYDEFGPVDPEPSYSVHEDEAAIGPVDPEPSCSALEVSPSDEQPEQCEQTPETKSEAKSSLVFNLEGPLENLGGAAKQMCQDWVDDSETLLVKVAKKTMIDAFQADFHSFLFLFQVQLKRMKRVDLKKTITTDDGASVTSVADDCSWVSAEPSVIEEDTRIRDIEKACVAFMNQMGNNMVRQYEELSGDRFKKASSRESATTPALAPVPDAIDERDDNQIDPTEDTKTAKWFSNVNARIDSIEARQSNTRANAGQWHLQLQPNASNSNISHLGVLASEGPEQSTVTKAKTVSFDIQESSDKLKAAIMQLNEQREHEFQRREKVRKAFSTSRLQKPESNLDFDDDEQAEESTRTNSYDSPSYDDTFEPSIETSATSADTESYSRSRSRTFSTELGDDDDTYPTFDSRRGDSGTFSPSELSFDECAERPKQKAGWADSWVPVWL